MESYTIQNLDPSCNTKMLSIIASSPIRANGLTLLFDKSPDLFTIPGLRYPESMHTGFFLGDELKGFASAGFYEAMVNGRPESVFMLFNFYLLPEARGRRLPEKAMQHFFLRAKGRADLGLAVIMKGNLQAESFIGRRGYPWMPVSRVIDDLVVKSLLFSVPMKNRTEYRVRNATINDVPEMVALLKEENAVRDFTTPVTQEGFLPSLERRGIQIENYYVAENRKGEIRGTCLEWDCSSFRRTRVLEYSPDFHSLLIGWKALSALFRMAPLPGKGGCFRELTITDYAASGRDVTVMHALLSEIYYRHLKQEYHFMNFGTCRSDPLLKSVSGFWGRNTVSGIVFTSLSEDRLSYTPHLPYIDIAYL